jgi:hypothetical protein
MGTWSDGTQIVPLTETDNPNPNAYPASPGDYNSYWTNPINPRNIYALVPEPPSYVLASIAMAGLAAWQSRKKWLAGRAQE